MNSIKNRSIKSSLNGSEALRAQSNIEGEAFCEKPFFSCHESDFVCFIWQR